MLGQPTAQSRRSPAALTGAIRRVYASTFTTTRSRTCEQRPTVWKKKRWRSFSSRWWASRTNSALSRSFQGGALARNYYPVASMTFEDGIAAVALGLGRAVVRGGKCLTFCPA